MSETQIPITTSKYRDNNEEDEPDEPGGCDACIVGSFTVIIILLFPIFLPFCIKIVQEYERAAIFRLGRLKAKKASGPGIFFVNCFTDTYCKVDLRTVVFDIPPQEVLTKDSVTIRVDAVCYYKVVDATQSVVSVDDASLSTRLLAQTSLRNILGTRTLTELLSGRDEISHEIQTVLDKATDPWGIFVERVELKDLVLPASMQRAMAAEAEASREAKAKIIQSEGEKNASKNIADAARIIAEAPQAIQLRYLQTLTTISAEKNSTIIFPLPIEMLPRN